MLISNHANAKGESRMESFRHKGKTLNFRKLTGVVTSIMDRSETRLHSSGGGGYVGPHGGYVSAPTIRMETTAKLEMWLKAEDGGEERFELPTTNIPAKEGQRVTLISYVGPEDKNYVSVLVNHNARRHWFIYGAAPLVNIIAFNPILAISGCVLQSAAAFSYALMSRMTILNLLAIALGTAIYEITSSPPLSWGVAGSLWLFYMIKKGKEFTSIRKNIETHLERLAEGVY